MMDILIDTTIDALKLIPFLFVWEEGCTCTNCLFTGYCEYTKKVKFVKNIFKFLGYDKDKIDNMLSTLLL